MIGHGEFVLEWEARAFNACRMANGECLRRCMHMGPLTNASFLTKYLVTRRAILLYHFVYARQSVDLAHSIFHHKKQHPLVPKVLASFRLSSPDAWYTVLRYRSTNMRPRQV